MTCNHDHCTCTVEQDQDYCSDHCADHADSSEPAATCDCGHDDCNATTSP